MVARKVLVRHDDSTFTVDYDTDDGFKVFQLQLFSLTSEPPEEQKIVGEDDDRIVSDDSDLSAVSEKLRLVSTYAEEDSKPAENDEMASNDDSASNMDSNAGISLTPEEWERVLQYEDSECQEAARNAVPVETLKEKALVSPDNEGNRAPSTIQRDHAFLLQLLSWFKRSFMIWVDAPPCDGCGKKTTPQLKEGGRARPEELQYGATTVELYRCDSDSCSVTRFPRYNDPFKKQGRGVVESGLIALHCFVVLLAYESRLILDFTDHVWTECYSEVLGRWMHLDPCEAEYDKPLLYENGWGKKLNYVIAIAKDGVYDVTKRYTRKWNEVLSRRDMIKEFSLVSVLASMTKECRRNYKPQVLSALDERDRNEREALERDLHSTDDDSISLPGN